VTRAGTERDRARDDGQRRRPAQDATRPAHCLARLAGEAWLSALRRRREGGAAAARARAGLGRRRVGARRFGRRGLRPGRAGGAGRGRVGRRRGDRRDRRRRAGRDRGL